MQNAAFAAAGVDAIYVPFRVAPAELATAVAGLRATGVAGWNATVPHKEAMIALVDELRPRARACGAVNTVVRTRRGLVGDNTDGAGFVAALAETRRSARGIDVLLIGAGGSARGVAHALVAAGAAHVVIANRTQVRAEALAAALGTRKASAAGLALLRDRTALGRFGLIVNCTSTGLASSARGRAADAGALEHLPFESTRPNALCCDLVYGSRPSAFLRHARRAGRPTMDGTGMLLHQGAMAFELWTGRPAPLAVMRRALRRALLATA